MQLYLCTETESGARRWIRVLNAFPALPALFAQARAYGNWAIARDGVLLAWNAEAPIAIGGLFEKVRDGAECKAG